MRKPDSPAERDDPDFQPQAVATETLDRLKQVAQEVGGPYVPSPEMKGAIGYTHFDNPSSDDNSVVVLLAKENMSDLPMQTLVRIKSLEDQHNYLGIVVAGPFAEPDGLRADSTLVVTTTVQGRIFLPRYHGRAFVQILGEEVQGKLLPPRFRPRPNSPVIPLSKAETEKFLQVTGDARLGVVVGQEEIAVAIPTDRKSVLPRHLGILGTTGGGKSTTVARLVQQLHKAGVATIVIDVEGEYTQMDQPTTDETMTTALAQRGLVPEGIDPSKFAVAHLVGRQTSRSAAPNRTRSFSLRFADLSPYAFMEILDLSEAQQERFLKTYDTLKLVLKDAGIFPQKGNEVQTLEIDELETGYPQTTLLQMIDLANAFADSVAEGSGDKSKKKKIDEDETAVSRSFPILSPELQPYEGLIRARVAAARAPGSLPSWRGLLGKLWRIHRLRLFDNPAAPPLNHAGMLDRGRVTVIDLSDIDSPQVNNLVIADVLRGVWQAQECHFDMAMSRGEKPTPVVVIIEEAHEFLSEQRIKQMEVLFQQVAKIAKRGRKRWLGLVFVTQLPQHLPNEVLGLINNYIVHQVKDSTVIERLRRSLSGIDKVQWNLISGLAPGQALVSLTSMVRPLLVSIDPTPVQLLLVN
ncbi:MAG: ATP-binding protein [Nitrospira sp.]|nr:ATP-binding protein [Nitrospira sp.]